MRTSKLGSLLLAVALISAVFATQVFAAPPSDPIRAELKGKIANVTGAVAKKFNAKDNLGNNMDTAKIIANPYVSGQFLAVYHTYTTGVAKLNLAKSTDLLNWTFIRALAGSSGNNATQGAIKAASDGGFVVAWEQEPNNHLKVAYYSSWSNLQNGIASKTYNCPRQLSSYAEGTPNIYSASSTSVDIGFHYFKNGDVDRQARGTLTNFNSWSSSTQPNMDNALLYWGVLGNIGDRDSMAYKGYTFGLMEGQFTKNDFGSFRPFIYDYATGNAEPLAMTTPAGSTAFGNPSFTTVTINGQAAVVVSMIIFSEGAQGSEGGQLIYYFYQ
ncbi:hypothetical protein [Paenibacillus lignilyticus]|uniref:Uncharacterized protein n=1 Tax=Paenibacillus lignilyticus TaxID=1172615 RepID=A0ABS5CIF7_9BACL|nr:hypothetical protein [Paenibacillus lignilyticus]MBP3965602.1 hypothetical protein [Paenibacillus lignilyticus]